VVRSGCRSARWARTGEARPRCAAKRGARGARLRGARLGALLTWIRSVSLDTFQCRNLIGPLRERKGFSCLCLSRETHEHHCRYAVPCRKLLREKERRIYSACCTYKIFSLTHSGCQGQVANCAAGVSAAIRWWRHQQMEATVQQCGRAAQWWGGPPSGRRATGRAGQRDWAPAGRDARGEVHRRGGAPVATGTRKTGREPKGVQRGKDAHQQGAPLAAKRTSGKCQRGRGAGGNRQRGGVLVGGKCQRGGALVCGKRQREPDGEARRKGGARAEMRAGGDARRPGFARARTTSSRKRGQRGGTVVGRDTTGEGHHRKGTPVASGATGERRQRGAAPAWRVTSGEGR